VIVVLGWLAEEEEEEEEEEEWDRKGHSLRVGELV
jgi:hypothetical protein